MFDSEARTRNYLEILEGSPVVHDPIILYKTKEGYVVVSKWGEEENYV